MFFVYFVISDIQNVVNREIHVQKLMIRAHISRKQLHRRPIGHPFKIHQHFTFAFEEFPEFQTVEFVSLNGLVFVLEKHSIQDTEMSVVDGAQT